MLIQQNRSVNQIDEKFSLPIPQSFVSNFEQNQSQQYTIDELHKRIMDKYPDLAPSLKRRAL